MPTFHDMYLANRFEQRKKGILLRGVAHEMDTIPDEIERMDMN